jgi:glycosyltransferase involved in cell wall biosynthesis
VQIGDVRAITDALAKILTQPELAEQFRAYGKQRVQAFDTPLVVQQYDALLKQAMVTDA